MFLLWVRCSQPCFSPLIGHGCMLYLQLLVAWFAGFTWSLWLRIYLHEPLISTVGQDFVFVACLDIFLQLIWITSYHDYSSWCWYPKETILPLTVTIAWASCSVKFLYQNDSLILFRAIDRTSAASIITVSSELRGVLERNHFEQELLTHRSGRSKAFREHQNQPQFLHKCGILAHIEEWATRRPPGLIYGSSTLRCW